MNDPFIIMIEKLEKCVEKCLEYCDEFEDICERLCEHECRRELGIEDPDEYEEPVGYPDVEL